ncbi:MAG: hypothetical protein M3X11_07620, partial [Acidobacteriota bacterium]|nr:hypothetical protein [Acidobacteriota bacterium]
IKATPVAVALQMLLRFKVLMEFDFNLHTLQITKGRKLIFGSLKAKTPTSIPISDAGRGFIPI